MSRSTATFAALTFCGLCLCNRLNITMGQEQTAMPTFPEVPTLPHHSIFRSTSVDLNKYIIDYWQPIEDLNRRYNRATDALATFLKGQREFSVAETVKGGSLGKGTAIRGHCDLDLVLFLNGYPTVESFKEALPEIVRKLVIAVRRWSPEGFNVAVLKTNKRLVELTMNTSGGASTFRIRVDLVPAFARRGAAIIYQEMQSLSPVDRSYYSSSLARQQIGFVIERPASLKNLIRLVKAWRNEHLRENEEGLPKIPKSYALELVTIHVWESLDSPTRFTIDRMFKTILLTLVDYTNINASWTTYYSAEERDVFSSGTKTRGKPFILDPADPFHNVGNDFDWKEMAQMASATAQSPRLSAIEPCH